MFRQKQNYNMKGKPLGSTLLFIILVGHYCNGIFLFLQKALIRLLNLPAILIKVALFKSLSDPLKALNQVLKPQGEQPCEK